MLQVNQNLHICKILDLRFLSHQQSCRTSVDNPLTYQIKKTVKFNKKSAAKPVKVIKVNNKL